MTLDSTAWVCVPTEAICLLHVYYLYQEEKPELLVRVYDT